MSQQQATATNLSHSSAKKSISKMPAAPPFPNLVISHLEGRARTTHYRRTQLHRLQEELVKSKAEIKNAIKADYGHTPAEIDFEYALVLSELRQHYEAFDSKQAAQAVRQIEFGNDNAENRRTASIVYIVPCTHTTTFSVLSPLCAAIASGSCVIVELPQTLRSVTSALRRVLLSSLDSDTFAISESRPADKDFLRDCTVVEQTQPQKPLLPGVESTLSSSSRVLAIVDRTATVDEAAKAVIHARFSRAGGSPYAPDAVLVNEFVLDEFMGRLLHHINPYMARPQENGHLAKGPTKQKSRRQSENDQDSIFESAEKSDTSQVVVRGSNGGVISVQDREHSLLKQKIDSRILIVHAISSLDDAIDLANQSDSVYSSTPLAASFIFASLQAATYLANFTAARVSCVNHIPAELLVGPICPNSDPASLSPRYTPTMFQEPRPQLLHKTALTKLAETTNDNGSKLAELQKSVTAALPPLNRRDGKDVDFFAQALMTGVATIVLPVLVGAGLFVRYGLPYVRS